MPDLVDASDTGELNDDNLTADAAPTFRVTSSEGVLVNLYGGENRLAQGALNDGTADLAVMSLGFVDQTYSITATSIDLAGNEGPRS
jgi:hypothetical protein